MADLTDEEIAELRKLAEGGKETALEWRAAALAAHPFLLEEVVRRRREVADLGAATASDPADVLGPGVDFDK